MEKVIPITERGFSVNELQQMIEELSNLNPAIQLQKVHGTGVAMDPGSIAVLVKIAELTVPALIGGLIAIWTARIEKNNSQNINEVVVRITVETDLNQHVIQVRLPDQQQIERMIENSGVPKDLDEVTRIYLDVE